MVRWVSGRAALGYRRWARRRARTGVSALTKRAWVIVRSKTYCLVVTESADGPTARVVEPFAPDVHGRICFGTDPDSRKVAHIRDIGRCLLVYQDDRRRACVTIECDAVVRPEGSRPRFRQSWRAFWPDGPGVGFVNVECTPTAIEVWDGLAVIAPEPFGRRQARVELRDGRWQVTS